MVQTLGGRGYKFEIQHLLVLFIVVVVFQTALSFINSQSTRQMFDQAMEYYRRDSAERIADLTTTALELQLEPSITELDPSPDERERDILALEKLFSQQVLQRNIDAVFLLVEYQGELLQLHEGLQIYTLFFEDTRPAVDTLLFRSSNAHDYYVQHRAQLFQDEQIISSLEGEQTFQVLVPFYYRGETVGAAYMQITPDVSGFLALISTAYNQSGVLFTGLILVGFMAMFFIYSYTARERDMVQQELFAQRSEQLKEAVEHEKESLFTKRIYHTHHKAEKVMGFIKEDLRNLSESSVNETRDRVTKYANFVSRVIYDMKSYDPPIHVIRNPMFRTDINEVIRFIVNNIFKRVYRAGQSKAIDLKLDLAEDLPILSVNEYVIWEIIEPLIQNAIDHNSDRELGIMLKTALNDNGDRLLIEISDTGRGIPAELLEKDNEGVAALFRESVSTKDGAQNSGYGCYLAREISRRCGWKIDAHNRTEGGATIIIEAGVS